MKFYLDYKQLKNICLSMADEMRKGFMPDQIMETTDVCGNGGQAKRQRVGQYPRSGCCTIGKYGGVRSVEPKG